VIEPPDAGLSVERPGVAPCELERRVIRDAQVVVLPVAGLGVAGLGDVHALHPCDGAARGPFHTDVVVAAEMVVRPGIRIARLVDLHAVLSLLGAVAAEGEAASGEVVDRGMAEEVVAPGVRVARLVPRDAALAADLPGAREREGKRALGRKADEIVCPGSCLLLGCLVYACAVHPCDGSAGGPLHSQVDRAAEIVVGPGVGIARLVHRHARHALLGAVTAERERTYRIVTAPAEGLGGAAAPPLPVPVFLGHGGLEPELGAVGFQPGEGPAARVDVDRVAALVVAVAGLGCLVAAVAIAVDVAGVEVLLLRHRTEAAVDMQLDARRLGRLGHREEGVGRRHLERLPVDRDQRYRKRLPAGVAGVLGRGAAVRDQLGRHVAGGLLLDVHRELIGVGRAGAEGDRHRQEGRQEPGRQASRGPHAPGLAACPDARLELRRCPAQAALRSDGRRNGAQRFRAHAAQATCARPQMEAKRLQGHAIFQGPEPGPTGPHRALATGKRQSPERAPLALQGGPELIGARGREEERQGQGAAKRGVVHRRSLPGRFREAPRPGKRSFLAPRVGLRGRTRRAG
jgi:hypothetical protein